MRESFLARISGRRRSGGYCLSVPVMSPEPAEFADLFAVIASLRDEVAGLRAELAERASDEDAVSSADGAYRAPRSATTREMCAEFNVKRSWAYRHRTELGAVQFGDGSAKPRLRWNMEVARAYWASLSLAEPAKPETQHGRRRRRSSKTVEQSRHTRAGNVLVDVPVWSISG